MIVDIGVWLGIGLFAITVGGIVYGGLIKKNK